MNKKLTILTAALLIALAVPSFPAGAPAGEFAADCKTGATCEATIVGGAVALSGTTAETLSCTSVSGSAALTSGTSTGTANMTFHGCRETVTLFKFFCSGVGQPSGTIATGSLPFHLIYLEEAQTGKKGALFTNVSMTFACSGFSNKTLTGSHIGLLTNPNCGGFSPSHTLKFTHTSHGQQDFKQITGTGAIFDLISNNDAGGGYSTWGEESTKTLTYAGGNEVRLTC
jgi:hypothetical protein